MFSFRSYVVDSNELRLSHNQVITRTRGSSSTALTLTCLKVCVSDFELTVQIKAWKYKLVDHEWRCFVNDCCQGQQQTVSSEVSNMTVSSVIGSSNVHISSNPPSGKLCEQGHSQDVRN